MIQDDVFIESDTTAGIELPQSPLTRKRTLAGEISRPAADSAADYPAEEVPNHPEAAADPSGFPAAASAHSSEASSAVEAASFLLAADRPAVECLEAADYHPAAGRLWAESPAEDCPEVVVPEAVASARSSGASSAVEAASSLLAVGQPAAEYRETAGCLAAAVPEAAVPEAAVSARSSEASSAAFDRLATATRVAAASAG